MVTVSALVIFFFLLVVVFPAVALAVSAAVWVAQRLAQNGPGVAGLDRRRLAQRTDRLKQSAFIVSVVLLFFLVTPFVVLVFVAGPF
ncbi:MAG: hypothetical protein U5J82_12325 [Desulfobacterales bacterium]|nr:hypothetical protein [Desulfobacterales bacterium]